MNDTPPEVEARYRAALMRKTPQERLAMAADMFSTAQAMALAGIQARLGRLDGAEGRVQLFLQFYGADFDAPRRERVIARLRARTESGTRLG
jgi:hypothetical protein